MTHANVIALAAFLLVKLTRFRGLRVVISERAASKALSAEPPLLRALLKLLMRVLYPHASALLGVSEGVSVDVSELVHLPAGRVQTISNPVNLSGLRAAAAEPLEHPWLQSDKPPLLVSAGRLVVQKDFATLLSAFYLLRQRQQANLVILGEGPTRVLLEAQVRDMGLADCVFLPGFDANPLTWMARAAVFVLSSRWEGFPGVLLQAMACGAPVVSTDCPHGPREILQDGRWGALVPVGDAVALAAAIAAVLQANPERPTGLRPPSPRCADYAPERIWAAYRQVLEV
jgi:glycosyltransferase involved in cell wall biosynthesis